MAPRLVASVGSEEVYWGGPARVEAMLAAAGVAVLRGQYWHAREDSAEGMLDNIVALL